MANAMPHTKDERTRMGLRRGMMGAMVMCMLMITALQGLTGGVSAAEAAPARDHRVVMYVYDSASLGLRDEHAALVDQINYAFALIDDGEADGSHWRGVRQVSAYLKRHPGVTGVMSVGGWGADGFSQACATREGRERLASSLLRLMDEHGFTGIDIDWEYPGVAAAGIQSEKGDVENWYGLLALLRRGLDERAAATGREHVLSVALGGGRQHLAALDIPRLNALVDQVVLMSYDLRGFDRVTGHHAGLYPDGKTEVSAAWGVEQLLSAGLAPGKLLMGIPAYGHMWRQVPGGGNGLGARAATSGNKTLSYAELQALETKGFTRYWDEDAQACWWFDGSSFVSGEDAQSLGAKVDYVRRKGILGAAVWSWNQDWESKLVEELQ